MIAFSFIVASVLSLAIAKPLARNLVVHESRPDVPEGFVNSGPASPDTVLDLRIALVQGDMAGLEEKLFAVSTPGSELYGQHLTKEEVEAFVRPSEESVAAVNQFLSDNGITAETASPAGDWLSFSIPVSQANDLFGAEFSTFTHEETGDQAIRTLSYAIPADLKGHLALVHPTLTFPNPFMGRPKVRAPAQKLTLPPSGTATAPASCNSIVTPTCLIDLYAIPTTPATQKSNVLGVSGFIDQFANEADLELFLENLAPAIPPTTTFTLQTLDGGSNPQNANEAGIEANLDIQYTVGLADGVPVTFISVGERNNDGLGGFLDIINALLAESAPPHVLTTSYGQNENTVSASLANQLCNAYMQLGARGTSILFASGDGGVAGSQTTRCTTFLPTFPSGCPFMTSVGATQGTTETAASFSSGGFSNIFAQPSYQSAAVSAYLTKLGNTNSGKFNRTGRGFPDVAAQGVSVEIALEGEGELVDGTSCASPIFASVISLVNDRLIAAGKSPLGFLNPFLYSAAGTAALKDITSGDNPGCNTNGFPAEAGWDPVTGLGTPSFTKLLTAVGL